jgi:hypothetical protein
VSETPIYQSGAALWTHIHLHFPSKVPSDLVRFPIRILSMHLPYVLTGENLECCGKGLWYVTHMSHPGEDLGKHTRVSIIPFPDGK